MSNAVNRTESAAVMAWSPKDSSELALKLRVQEGQFVVLSATEAAVCARALEAHEAQVPRAEN